MCQGDNRVLWQKVAKEVLDRVRRNKHDTPRVAKKSIDLSSVDSYLQLFAIRESMHIRALGTELMTSGKPIFQVLAPIFGFFFFRKYSLRAYGRGFV